MTLPMPLVIYDEYQQPWRVQPEDAVYEEARIALQAAEMANSGQNGESPKVVWPLAKIAAGRGYGWWTVFQKLDEFERDLEKLVPNPSRERLIAIDREYTPTELQDMLQRFGSYLATLNLVVAKIEAQAHALKESYKAGMQVAVARRDPKLTISQRESDVLAGQELFRQTRRLQIDNEATLILAKGWLDAYTAAYTAVSRLVTLVVGEQSLQTGRHA